ncbi:Eco29kI family restriction endonuclease [Cupriavidus plantarum]
MYIQSELIPQTQEPYNPLAKSNLGESVANALLRVPVHALRDTRHLVGAGVYAIYYVGSFDAYAPIADRNKSNSFLQPIYVGKAVPKGARKGGMGLDAGEGYALRSRLSQHAASINEADNLDLADFYYRALTVDDVWIPLGENVTIEKYQPLWNRVLDGFGNKTPGARRATQYRSLWDALHPGRKFVQKLALPEHPMSVTAIENRIADFFAGKLSESEKLGGAEDADDEGS